MGTLKNILLISYHALPMDVVASYRTKAYCDYLMKNDVFPTLITHRWEKDEQINFKYHASNDETIYEEHHTHHIIRLPRPEEMLSSQSSFKTLQFWLKGDFDLHLLNSYKVFKDFLFKHLRTKHYDAVLAIFSPHYHLKLAYELHKKFDIPYILDFRDLWDNQVVTNSYRPTVKKKIQDQLVKYYWKKWLKRSTFFTTTSTKWTHYLEQMSSNRGFVIPNGHEIRKVAHSPVQDQFKLTYFGRLYPTQNLEFLIEGIKRFVQEEQPEKFRLLLVGIKKAGNFDGLQLLSDSIDSKYIEIIDYLPKKELVEYCSAKSSMFFLPSFKEDNGQFMVKLYDYMALGKPIIIAPKVNADMEYVAKNTNAGIIVNSKDDVVTHLRKQYRSFLENGYPKILIKPEVIMKYHRQNQINKAAELIKDYL